MQRNIIRSRRRRGSPEREVERWCRWCQNKSRPAIARSSARYPSAATATSASARKLVEIANATEAAQDARSYIELINNPFLKEGGTPDQYRAALARAATLGWLWLHESGTYERFTAVGAELFG
jgi:hypothetical protein